MSSLQRPTSGYAKATLVLGLLGLALPALICAFFGYRQIRRSNHGMKGRWMLRVGLIALVAWIPLGLYLRVTFIDQWIEKAAVVASMPTEEQFADKAGREIRATLSFDMNDQKLNELSPVIDEYLTCAYAALAREPQMLITEYQNLSDGGPHIYPGVPQETADRIVAEVQQCAVPLDAATEKARFGG